MRYRLWLQLAWGTCLLTGVALPAQENQDKSPIVSVKRIWDAAPHNAFTDLIRYEDHFYCTFREGANHVPRKREEDGKIRVIRSHDGQRWESVALLAKETVDLRDSKLSITPDGRLMLLMGGSYYDNGRLIRRRCQVSFLSPSAGAFGEITPIDVDPTIATDVDWLWRVTWHNGVGYGVVYQPVEANWGLHLVQTVDGVRYQSVTRLDVPGRPNEATVRFDQNGAMRIVVRNEAGNRAHLGFSRDPFRDFQWREIDHRLGGPNLIQLPNDSWVLATRAYGNPTQTVLERLEETGESQRLVSLPSGGDTSYPGLVVHEGELWVSYYSSHEDKTSIYLARIDLAGFD